MFAFFLQTLIALLTIALSVDLGRPVIAGARAAATYAETRDPAVCGLVVPWNKPLRNTDCLWTATARTSAEQSYLVRAFLGREAAQTLQALVRDERFYAWSLYLLQLSLAGYLLLTGLGRVAGAAWGLMQSKQGQVVAANGQLLVPSPPELEDWAS